MALPKENLPVPAPQRTIDPVEPPVKPGSEKVIGPFTKKDFHKARIAAAATTTVAVLGGAVYGVPKILDNDKKSDAPPASTAEVLPGTTISEPLTTTPSETTIVIPSTVATPSTAPATEPPTTKVPTTIETKPSFEETQAKEIATIKSNIENSFERDSKGAMEFESRLAKQYLFTYGGYGKWIFPVPQDQKFDFINNGNQDAIRLNGKTILGTPRLTFSYAVEDSDRVQFGNYRLLGENLGTIDVKMDDGGVATVLFLKTYAPGLADQQAIYPFVVHIANSTNSELQMIKTLTSNTPDVSETPKYASSTNNLLSFDASSTFGPNTKLHLDFSQYKTKLNNSIGQPINVLIPKTKNTGGLSNLRFMPDEQYDFYDKAMHDLEGAKSQEYINLMKNAASENKVITPNNEGLLDSLQNNVFTPQQLFNMVSPGTATIFFQDAQPIK